MPDQLLSGVLLLLVLGVAFRAGQWFCTAYDTSFGHYIVAALMVGGAIYVLIGDNLQRTLWFVGAFTGFYAGLFIGGHRRLWAEEERKAAEAGAGTDSPAPGSLAGATARCAVCGREHAKVGSCAGAST